MAESQSVKARRAREAAARGGKSNVTQLNPAGGAAGTSGAGKPLSKDDNRKAAEAAEEAQLLSYLAVLRKQQTAVEAAKVVLDAAKEEMNSTFGVAGNAGFKRKELAELLADTKVKGQRKNIEEAERRRNRFRRYCGLPVGDSDKQAELDERLPKTTKDEIDWEADGYRAGVAADPPVAPKEAVKAGFDQAWLKGYHNGQARNAWALSAAKGLTPMPSVPPAANPTVEEIEKAIAPMFEADGSRPTLAALHEARDTLIAEGGQPSDQLLTAIAAREAENEAPAGGAEVIDLAAEKDVLTPDDFTEATEEELAAQVRRPKGDEPDETV